MFESDSSDADTKRTTGKKLVIKDSTLDQLRALDAGNWKDPKYAGEKLPTLTETLATSGILRVNDCYFDNVNIGITVTTSAGTASAHIDRCRWNHCVETPRLTG